MDALKFFASHLIALLVGAALMWAYLRYSAKPVEKPKVRRKRPTPEEIARRLREGPRRPLKDLSNEPADSTFPPRRPPGDPAV